MEAFLNTLSNIFGAFGSGIIIPVILFVLSKAMGVETKKAFNSALLCGVGLTGFNLVINSYSGVIAPIVQSMVDNTGVQLSTLDTGWQSTSIIAYSTTVGVLFIGVAIALQLVLFFVGYTDVFMASDLHGLGFHVVCIDEEHAAGYGFDGRSAVLHPALL